MNNLIEILCNNMNVSLEDLTAKSRKGDLNDTRHVIWHLLRKEGYTTVEIAQAFDRTHGAVSSGTKRVEGLIKSNDSIITILLYKAKGYAVS